MTELHCRLEAEHIAILSSLTTKIDALEDKVNELSKLDSVNTKLATILEFQTQAGDKRDKLVEKQSDILNRQNVTLAKIDDNLSNLTVAIKETNAKVAKLEDKVYEKMSKIESKVDEAEGKNMIDTRGVVRNIFLRVVFPAGAVLSVGAWVLKLLKVI